MEPQATHVQAVPTHAVTPIVEASRLSDTLFQSTHIHAKLPSVTKENRLQIEIHARGENEGILILKSADAQVFQCELSSVVNVHKDTNFMIEGEGPALYSFFSATDSLQPLAVVTVEKNDVSSGARKQHFIFEYVISQYCNLIDAPRNEGTVTPTVSAQAVEEPSVLASGIEELGKGVASALRFTSKALGSGIRFAGEQYKQRVAAREAQAVTQEEIEKAKRERETAKSIHNGAEYVTAAVMAPVRYVGKTVSRWASGEQVAGMPAEEPSGYKKAVVDTLSGLGNAITHVNKGLSDAVSEIGLATGDAVMQYSRVHYGEAYTEQVMKLKLDAAGHIGKAAHCGYYVATLGSLGMAEAIVLEGVDQAFNAYDYLKGPILMQGWLMLSQPPLHTKYRLRFVVVRTWSISWYKTAQDMGRSGPERLIPTSNLGTRPYIDGEPPTLTFSTMDHSPYYIRAVNQPTRTGEIAPPNELLKWRRVIAEAASRIETIQQEARTAFGALQESKLQEMPKPLRYIITIVAAKDIIASTVSDTNSIYVSIVPLLFAGDEVESERHTSEATTFDRSNTAAWDPLEIITIGQNASVSPATCQGLLVKLLQQSRRGPIELGRAILHLSPASWSPTVGQPLVIETNSKEVLHEGWFPLNTPPEILTSRANTENASHYNAAVHVQNPQLQIIYEMHAVDDFSLQQVHGPQFPVDDDTGDANEEIGAEDDEK